MVTANEIKTISDAIKRLESLKCTLKTCERLQAKVTTEREYQAIEENIQDALYYLRVEARELAAFAEFTTEMSAI